MPKCDQFRRVFASIVDIACGRADVNPYVTAVSPAQLLQPLCKRREAGLPFRIVRGQTAQHADAPHPLALLRGAASGRAAIAPPSNVMNSRRFSFDHLVGTGEQRRAELFNAEAPSQS